MFHVKRRNRVKRRNDSRRVPRRPTAVSDWIRTRGARTCAPIPEMRASSRARPAGPCGVQHGVGEEAADPGVPQLGRHGAGLQVARPSVEASRRRDAWGQRQPGHAGHGHVGIDGDVRKMCRPVRLGPRDGGADELVLAGSGQAAPALSLPPQPCDLLQLIVVREVSADARPCCHAPRLGHVERGPAWPPRGVRSYASRWGNPHQSWLVRTGERRSSDRGCLRVPATESRRCDGRTRADHPSAAALSCCYRPGRRRAGADEAACTVSRETVRRR